MNLMLQKKFLDNPKLYNHLKENSKWIKYLNRNPENFKLFESKMKELYKERTTDKVKDVIDNMELITTFLNAMK